MPQPLIRVLNHGGERWLNLTELKALVCNRVDLLDQALAMLKVAADKFGIPDGMRPGMMGAIGSVLQAAVGEDDGEIVTAVIKGKELELAQDYYDALAAIRDGEQPDAAAFAKEFLGASKRPGE